MKNRLLYVDQMRGLAILLIIVLHLVQYNGFGMGHPVFLFVYSFVLPLFFFISGYIGAKTTNISNLKSYGSFLWKKTITLVLPYLFWAYIVDHYFFASKWELPALTDYNNGSYWFLTSLFLLFVFYGLFHLLSGYFNKRNNIIIDIFLIGFVCCLLFASKYFIHFIMISFVFTSSFFLGVLISKYQKLENLVKNDYVFDVCLFLFMVLAALWPSVEPGFQDRSFQLTVSVCAFISMYNICRRVKWNSFVSNQLMLFGKYSLCIYLIQFQLTYLIPPDIKIAINPFILFILCTVVSIPVAYCSVGFAKIIEKAPILNLLMFGKLGKSKIIEKQEEK